MKTSITALAQNVDSELLENGLLMVSNEMRRAAIQKRLRIRYLTDDEVTELANEYERAMNNWHDARRTYEALANVQAAYNWNRAWIVSGGHVHKVEKGCPGFKANTTAHLLPQCSALTEDEIVDLAGERACTHCFPSAPVDKLRQPSRLFALDEAEKVQRKAEREAKASEKEARKVSVVFGEVNNGRGGTYIDRETYGSVRSARNAAMDAYWWLLYAVAFGGANTRSLVEERFSKFRKITEAITAHRDGEVSHIDELEKELIAKVETKFVREMRGDKTRVEFLDEVREALVKATETN
jgi:hypothetical protein